MFGHELEPDQRRDGGRTGQYYACHAKKQLIAYFISKHALINGRDNKLLLEAVPPFQLMQATILSVALSVTTARDSSQLLTEVI